MKRSYQSTEVVVRKMECVEGKESEGWKKVFILPVTDCLVEI